MQHAAMQFSQCLRSEASHGVSSTCAAGYLPQLCSQVGRAMLSICWTEATANSFDVVSRLVAVESVATTADSAAAIGSSLQLVV
jgi:hypothetical protein